MRFIGDKVREGNTIVKFKCHCGGLMQAKKKEKTSYPKLEGKILKFFFTSSLS